MEKPFLQEALTPTKDERREIIKNYAALKVQMEMDNKITNTSFFLAAFRWKIGVSRASGADV